MRNASRAPCTAGTLPAAGARHPHAAVVELAGIALRSGGFDDLMVRAAASIARSLGTDCCYVLEHRPGARDLVLRAGAGWDEALIGRATVRSGIQSYAGATLAAGGPLAVYDLRAERRFKIPPLLRNRGLRSAAGVAIPGPDRPFGILGIGTTCRRAFAPEELGALEFAGSLLATAIQSKRAETRAQRQLQRLAGLRTMVTAIASSLDMRLTLSVLLDQVTSLLGVDAAAVLLLNPRSLTLEHGAARGLFTGARQDVRLRLGEGHAGRAALERRVICIRDLGKASCLAAELPSAGEGFVAYVALPLTAKGQVRGVLELFHRSPLDPDADWLDFAQTLAGHAAIAIDGGLLYDELQRSHMELTLAYDTPLEGWSRALDLRDHATEGHTRRVTEMTLRLARAMGLDDAELVHVRRGAILHDIGKMAIPDAVLLKPGPLTEDEWRIMRRHPVYAYELLSPIRYLRPALDIPYGHHERWDGKGYPRGLEGERIPLSARIFAVVDVWDALRSDRPYRKAWPEDRVMEYIRGAGGIQFDPQVLELFLELTN